MAASSEPVAGHAVKRKKGKAAKADRQHEKIEHGAVLRCLVPRALPTVIDSANGARVGKFGSTKYIFESGSGRSA
jgi:hypothetical protein